MQHDSRYTANDIQLKPMLRAQASAYSFGSSTNDNAYNPIAPDHSLAAEYATTQAADRRLKNRIRILKLASRIIALTLSVVTLVPLTMTLTKFLLTRNTYFTVDGQQRTAWAKNSITWYTYMYFGVALISCVFNLAIVMAYWRGIRKANNVASIASWWSNSVLVGHVLIWLGSAALYRYGKEPAKEKFRDLWGWTCSAAAQEIQKDIPNVNFGHYCTVQTASFYSGLANVATGILSGLIVLLMALRVRSKKRVQKLTSQHQSDMEPLRS